MKRLLSTLLLIVMLTQALPVNALAAIGKVLSKEDLAAAYALTGYGDGLRANAYHPGMLPNESWSASQLSAYLGEQLDLGFHNLSDILSRISYTLAENASAREEFENRRVVQRFEALNVEVETLRQELRYLKDRVDTDGNIIAEMGRIMTESENTLFPSERVRASAKIEAAVKELVELRETITQNAPLWHAQVEEWQRQLQVGPADAEDDQHIGDAVSNLFKTASQPVTNSATVATVNLSNSRMSRLASAAHVEANEAEASVTVINKNQVCISTVTGVNMTREAVPGVRVLIGDALDDDESDYEYYYTDEDGLIVLPSNMFTADAFDAVHLYVRIEAGEQGYRDMMIQDLDLELGDVYTAVLQPLEDPDEAPVANGAASNDILGPYIVSACLNKKDIMFSKYSMIYSTVNDQDFEIRVEVANAEGMPELKLRWYENNGSLHSLKRCWASPTTHKGNVYTFKGPWKKRFSPNASKEQRPTFFFGDNENAPGFTTQLVSTRSATDKPIGDGTGGLGGVFGNVLGSGLGLNFTIPVGKNMGVSAGLNLPFTDYLPKFSTDCAGFVVMYIGSDVFSDMVKKAKANWQSKDLRELSRAQTYVEKESGFANYMAQYNLARDFYREKGWKLLGSSTFKFGVFAVATGRWQLDNDDPDVKTKLVTVRAGLGFTMTYAYSWTFSYPLGPVPVNITFTIGVNAGFSLSYEINFCWVNGSFKNWEIKAIRDITISVVFYFTAQFGVGVRGFLEGWVKFTASLNLMIRLYLDDDEPSSLTIGYSCSLAIGITLFLASASFSWTFLQGTLYPEVTVNSANLLEHYMNASNGEPEVMEAVHDAPLDYPDLAPEAECIKRPSSLSPVTSPMKVVTVNGQTFAFFIGEDVLGGDNRRRSVHWLNTDIDTRYRHGSLRAVLTSREASNMGQAVNKQDYAFDVYTADGLIYLVALCAEDFDADGQPMPIDLSSETASNTCFYLVVLEPTSDGELTHMLSLRNEARKSYFMCARPANFDYYSKNEYSHDSALDPHISYAYPEWKDKGRKILRQFRVYGSTRAVDHAHDRAPCGATGFVYEGGYGADNPEKLIFISDAFVHNGGGDDYERAQFFVNEMGQHPTFSPSDSYQQSMSFIALSRPKNGGRGDSVIELYDYELADGKKEKRKDAVVIETGAIDHIQVVSKKTEAGPVNTVFYAVKETNSEGEEQFRLRSLYIEPTQTSLEGDDGAVAKYLDFVVTKYEYDMVLPTNNFNVTYLGETPYLYWVNAAPRQKEGEPDTWRVYLTAYDISTNTFTTPAMFAQFRLPKLPYGVRYSWGGGYDYMLEPAMESIILTPTGEGYFSAVAEDYSFIDEEFMPKTAPRALYSFPVEFRPSASLKMAVPQELAVAAGNYVDVCLGIMNEGNLGITTMDLAMYDVSGGGSGDLVETLHFNAVDPDKNKITLQNGETVLQGKEVAYRMEDYDLGAAQQDWVLSHEKNHYRVKVHHDNNKQMATATLDGEAQYVTSDVLMPSSTAAYIGAFKIPESWASKNGKPVKKNLRLKVSAVSVVSNRVGLRANASDEDGLITYALDKKTGKLVLQKPKANSLAAEAVSSGLYASEIDASDIDLDISIHDLSVSHRQYIGWDGQEWLDIMVHNFTAYGDSMKLTCAVYVDGSEEPRYVSLPYYEKAVTDNRTHTISVPVSALVDDPAAHSRARVEILSAGTEERAYANNEFYLWLDGSAELTVDELYGQIDRNGRPVVFTEVISAHEGDTVTMHVSVSGGTSPYRYQWQVYDPNTDEWINLPDGGSIRGATTDTLTLDHVKPEWDGRRARCVIVDDGGKTIETASLTLRVRNAIAPGGGGGEGGDALPDTGDHSRLPLYLIIALAALLALWRLRRRGRE